MGSALEKYKKKMAAAADDYAGEEKQGGSFITTRGGILKYGEEELPGNEMLVIVLDAVHENTYYDGKFDPGVMLPPKCFAFGRNDKEMEAHANVPDPEDEGAEESYFELQSETGMCSDCPLSQWGSADTGKGKACSNRRRLAVIPAGRFVPTGKRRETDMEIFEEPSDFRDGDIAFLKLPVTSTKNWAKYVHKLNQDHQAPPFAAITHIYLEQDAKTQFKICFDLIEIIDDEDVLDILFNRNEEARGQIIKPYTEPDDEALDAPKAKAKTGLAGLKAKKKSKKER